MVMGGPKRVVPAKSWINEENELPAAAPTSGGAPALDPASATTVPVESAAVRWPNARIAAVQALWGEGFTMPGGGPETLRLAKPLGLSSSVTLLLLGGGLGGPAHAITDGFGAWVASFEADPDLLAFAAQRRPTLDPQNRISIDGWDRAAPKFRSRSANHAMALEALRGTKPAPLLEGLAGALRPNGQIVLTELVCDAPPSERDREFAAWCRLENRQPDLPSSAEVTETLQRLHFDVRVVEDMSDRHMSQTLGGWREAVRAMAAGPRPAPQTAAAFVTEAELWLLRIRLMRRLGVRLMRWHAIGGI
jgi:hypothetical protein